MSRRPSPVTALCAAALLLGACSEPAERSSPSPPPTPSRAPAPTGMPTPPSPVATPTAAGTPRVVGTVADDLEVPWGLAFLPDGDALVTERDSGRVLRVGPDGDVREVGTVPDVAPTGEGGLLGVAVSPDFARDRSVVLYYTTEQDNRIVRHTLAGGRLRPDEVLVDGIPHASFHDGGRLVFGPDGMLYAGTGEAGVPERSQDRDSLGGKILRMTPDGGVPPDNPFPGSLVYSLGHRNVQGLAFDPQGRLWASEFGQSTWDELNLVRPGRNYGWPHVEGRGGDGRFTDPVRQWSTDEASPSGVAWLGGAVHMAALRGERLWQVPVDGARAGRPADHLTGRYGRLRTVVTAPDGSLWLTTSNTDGRGDPAERDDRVLRVSVR